MKELFKNCFFPVDNIRVLVSKGKYSPCLTNHHVHSYWEIKTFPDGNETTKFPLVMLIPPNVVHDATASMFSEGVNFVLGFMQPRITLQINDDEGGYGERLCLFSQVDDLCPGGLISVLRKIQVLQAGKTDRELLEKLLNDLISLLFSAVNIAFESTVSIDGDAGFSLIERACDYIERQYYHGDLTVEKIAVYLGVTAGHLANLFKKGSLGTVRQYLIKTRLKHAAQLLSSGRYTVKDITELTGWNSQFYFSNCFKKYYKMSPSAVPLDSETKIIRTKDE